MKKVTIILSIFVFAISSQTFAQNTAKPATLKNKPTEPKPGEAGYRYELKNILVTSAQPTPASKPAAKPAPKPAAKPIAIPAPAPKPTPILLPAVQQVREAARRTQ